MANHKAEITKSMREGDKFCTCCSKIGNSLSQLENSCDLHAYGQGGSKVLIGAGGIAGSACLIAAPFTAGISVLVGGIICAGCAATAGVGHAIGSYVVNTKQGNKLLDLSKELEAAAKSYDITRQQVGQSQVQISTEVLARLGLDGFSAGFGTVMMTTDQLMRALTASSSPALIVKNIAAGSGTLARAGGSASQSGAELVAAAGSGASVGTKVMGVAGGAFGIAFGVLDICFGIHQLVTVNATAEACRDLSRQVQDLKNKVKVDTARLRAIYSAL